MRTFGCSEVLFTWTCFLSKPEAMEFWASAYFLLPAGHLSRSLSITIHQQGQLLSILQSNLQENKPPGISLLARVAHTVNLWKTKPGERKSVLTGHVTQTPACIRTQSDSKNHTDAETRNLSVNVTHHQYFTKITPPSLQQNHYEFNIRFINVLTVKARKTQLNWSPNTWTPRHYY